MQLDDQAEPMRLWLAPIRGVTDAAWRRSFAARFGGFDAAISPFLVSEKRRPVRDKDLADALGGDDPGIPTVPQILTADAGDFVALAGALADRGCREVNWNLGCPYPMVTRRGRGAGLLAYPDRARAFLDEACKASPCRISVKMRVGLHDASEAAALLSALDDYPLTLVVIHPRTADQMYGDRADVEAFERCLPRTRHRIAFNGDISSAAGLAALRARFPSIADWMVGRGALSNPWLPRELRGLGGAPDDAMSVLRAFHDDMLAHYKAALSGPGHVLDKMQSVWEWVVPGVQAPGRLPKKLLKARSLESFLALADQLFASGARWRGP